MDLLNKKKSKFQGPSSGADYTFRHTPLPLASATRLGPYEILAPLGQGGMGEVYKARDTRLDRLVALKVIQPSVAASPEMRERFEREARAISALDHPHICVLYDVCREIPAGASGVTGAGDSARASRFSSCSTSKARRSPIGWRAQGNRRPIRRGRYLARESSIAATSRGPLPFDTALQYAIEIAHALDAAHRRGIVHRDLKPGNVMITKAGTKLLDFGLAKLAADGRVAGVGGVR